MPSDKTGPAVANKEALMQLLQAQHLCWIQRSVMNPELHMQLVSPVDCLDRIHREILGADAQSILDLLNKD